MTDSKGRRHLVAVGNAINISNFQDDERSQRAHWAVSSEKFIFLCTMMVLIKSIGLIPIVFYLEKYSPKK